MEKSHIFKSLAPQNLAAYSKLNYKRTKLKSLKSSKHKVRRIPYQYSSYDICVNTVTSALFQGQVSCLLPFGTPFGGEVCTEFTALNSCMVGGF